MVTPKQRTDFSPHLQRNIDHLLSVFGNSTDFIVREITIFLFFVSHVEQVKKWKKALMKSAFISGSAFYIMNLYAPYH